MTTARANGCVRQYRGHEGERLIALNDNRVKS